MKTNPGGKYQAFTPIQFPKRRWPEAIITGPPIWCSVDLRDGNQALVEPMGPERKSRFFSTLVAMGFKEIEVGFPASSSADFDFVRSLIDENSIPEDGTIQVLTEAREDLIRRTFESIRGCRRAIVHLYNSTSELQRRVVFGLGRTGITKIATDGAALIRDLARDIAGESKIAFEYSPESFTGTELDYAKEICEAVMDVFRPTPSNKLILNLPATVEMATPNIYADQIEWFSRNIKNRESIILSLHPHNDRGTGVAAAELGVMAGADRIEGTLFGNGERTGNVDIITLALNMFTQGIDPGLDISDVEALKQVAEHCNRLRVHPRHPYAGELVFTAFSGSHQDAINKGFKARRGSNSPLWEIPYLPIDPQDVGRSYEAVIRINSQSGKGGIAYVLEQDYGVALPRKLQIEFSKIVQQIADSDGTELTSARIWECFQREYLSEQAPLDLVDHQTWPEENGMRGLEATISENGTRRMIEGCGNGPVDAYLGALAKVVGEVFEIVDYHEHSIGRGAGATAIAYVEMSRPNGVSLFGVGMNKSIVTASLRAVTNALNRLTKKPCSTRNSTNPAEKLSTR